MTNNSIDTSDKENKNKIDSCKNCNNPWKDREVCKQCQENKQV